MQPAVKALYWFAPQRRPRTTASVTHAASQRKVRRGCEVLLRQQSSQIQCRLCLRFFDAGQFVSFVLGGVARVDKSDKVEAAGCKCRAMGKAQAPVPDIGSRFAGCAGFGGSVLRSLAWDQALLQALLWWLGSRFDAWNAMNRSLPLTGAASDGLGNRRRTGGSSSGLLSWRGSGSGDLATPEGFNDAHLSATAGAWLT